MGKSIIWTLLYYKSFLEDVEKKKKNMGGDPLKNNPIPTTNHTDDSEVLFLG